MKLLVISHTYLSNTHFKAAKQFLKMRMRMAVRLKNQRFSTFYLGLFNFRIGRRKLKGMGVRLKNQRFFHFLFRPIQFLNRSSKMKGMGVNMVGFLTMVTMNLKLLLRNKGYLAFLFILPILSVMILNVENQGMNSEEDIYAIHELKTKDQTIINVANTRLSVKVYDSSDSEGSNYILNELARTGSFRIYRYKSAPMTTEEVRKEALSTANENVIGAVIYIPETFESEVLSGNNVNQILLFEATKDERISLLKSNLNTYVQSISQFAILANDEKETFTALLHKAMDNEMQKEIISIAVGDTLNLTAKQQQQKSNLGYSLAFLTLGFLFSGVFIAATVVEERHNRVYNRVLLSMSSLINYGLVKLVMVFLTVIMQTGILAITLKLIVKMNFGISFSSYILFVFCLGLIFNIFSVVVGVITNNVLTSNYIAFLVWCLSALLAGLYFPLDGASGWWSKVSLLMPQRWVIKASEMLMAGKEGAYRMYFLVVIGFLLVIMSIGFMGIRMRKKEA